MKIYLDDNITDHRLYGILVRAGHVVTLPADVSLSKASDPRHLTWAIEKGLIMLTGNHGDFDELHCLVLASGGKHPGIFVVRYDNDYPRDMKPAHIASAIGRVERSGVPVANEIIILNHWR
jgi:predicted nuclease of predicted toxin-antitoxin system